MCAAFANPVTANFARSRRFREVPNWLTLKSAGIFKPKLPETPAVARLSKLAF
jgi:hypothetical protein